MDEAEPTPRTEDATDQAASLVCRALDAAPVGLAIVGFDGVVLAANRTLVGWSRLVEPPQRLRGLQLLSQQDRALAVAVERAQRGDTSVLDGARPPLVPDHSGSFRLHVAPFVVEGELRAASVLYEDRTDPDVAAEAFEAAERRFRLLVDSAGDGIVVHRNGILLYVNPAGLKILGHDSPDELVGRRVVELYHRRGRNSEVVGEHGPLDAAPRRAWFVRRDGNPAEVEVRASRAPLGDGLATFLFFRDLGELSRLRESSPANASDSSPQAAAEQPLILVCDDEARLAALTADLLEQHALHAVTARTLDEVVAALERHGGRIGAMLLDLDLGGHDATEVLGLLEQRGLRVPVLLTSGYAPEDVPRSLINHPRVFGYLGKPYPVEELVGLARAALAARGVVE
jgi:PAS domain S-box-containing protein